MFEDVTAETGMNENNDRFSFAPAWCDFDGDGWPDLYVANDFGRGNLYRNRDGQFPRRSRQGGPGRRRSGHERRRGSITMATACRTSTSPICGPRRGSASSTTRRFSPRRAMPKRSAVTPKAIASIATRATARSRRPARARVSRWAAGRGVPADSIGTWMACPKF